MAYHIRPQRPSGDYMSPSTETKKLPYILPSVKVLTLSGSIVPFFLFSFLSSIYILSLLLHNSRYLLVIPPRWWHFYKRTRLLGILILFYYTLGLLLSWYFDEPLTRLLWSASNLSPIGNVP